MTFDSLLLYAVSRQVTAALLGGRVSRVFMPASDAAVLEFLRRGQPDQLLFSWNPQYARVHLTVGAEPERGLTCSFVNVLRRFLRGARLESAAQVGFDRVFSLAFSNAENLGPESRCLLLIEPIGRWANAVLLDPSGVIREAARHVPADVNRHRVLLPGEPYRPPPGADLPPLSALTAEALHEAATKCPESTLSALVSRRFQGASPRLLAELWARTGLDPHAPCAQQPTGWAASVQAAVGDLLQEAQHSAGYLYRPPKMPPLAYPVRLFSLQAGSPEILPSISAALEIAFAEQITAAQARQTRERLHAAVIRARQVVERRRQARESAVRAAAEADRWREFGEALLANLWRIPPGASQVEVPLYTAEGECLLTVPLNPNHSPQDNAQRYFERYKKARRAAQALPALLEADRCEEDYLAEVADQIDRADPADLAELEEELRRRGYLKRPVPRARVASETRDLPRLVGPEGWTLWYGKTGLQNDRLLRQASPDDLWFHVAQGPGGHVLLRTGGRPEQVPEAALHFAARLAAGLSRRRFDRAVEVAITLAKHVRKPRGAPPGFVLFSHASTRTVEPLYPPPPNGSV